VYLQQSIKRVILCRDIYRVIKRDIHRAAGQQSVSARFYVLSRDIYRVVKRDIHRVAEVAQR